MFELFVIAQQSGGPRGSTGCFSSLVVFGLIFLIFWFIVIRPEQKKAEEHKDFLDKLKVGDRVVTSGGVFGEVTAVDDDTVKLRINRDNRITVLRQQIKGAQSDYVGGDDEEDEDASEDAEDGPDEEDDE